MIEKLSIKNYLIIKEIEIEFSEGLNILTGETGAGKSIILDALSMILGERADYSLIKEGQEKLVVEAYLNLKNKNIVDLLIDILPEESDPGEFIILRREILKKGISRNFINDIPVNISDMKRLGDEIIDIHSQNEHQSLLNKDTHQEILDDFSNKVILFNDYKREFEILRDKIKVYEELNSRKKELLSKKSFLNFELKEINNLNLYEDEDIIIENELTKMENAEDITLALNSAVNLLYDNDSNALNQINSSLKELKKILSFDKNMEKIIEDLENAEVLVKESSEYLIRYINEIDFDSQKIEQLRNRLSSIMLIKKKYNLTVNDLILKAVKLQEELTVAENFDYEAEQILKKINEQKEIVFKTAKSISDLRQKKAKELEKEINSLFKEIGLESSEFKVEIKSINGNENDLYSVKKGKEYLKLGKNGYDEIEFLIKTNKGSDFAPLRKSASGGEVSRIMLAIKTALSENSNIPVMIFDEIDSGISGRIAQKVGKILKKLSLTHQIICITHLPQIAAMSTKHFHVNKTELNGLTTAIIKSLSLEEKINEVAKLLSGEKITESSKKSALELIKG